MSSAQVNITEDDIAAALGINVRVHVRLSGLMDINPKVIAKDLETIKRCSTPGMVSYTMEEIKERWARLGIFRSVQYNLEPTKDGADNDICVHIDVVEGKPKQSVGIFTTETSLPEVTVALENVLGGRYSLKGSYIPPASRVHAISCSLVSNVPFIGQKAEYYFGRRTESKAYHLASAERIEEVKATAENKKAGFASEFSVGFQRRTLVTHDRSNIPPSVQADFITTDKGYISHEVNFSNVAYHATPYLYNMYPLPIYGRDTTLRNEFAGGIFGGDFTFFKSELQSTQYWPLGPFLSFQWSTRLAGIFPFRENRIPLNDRLFLSNCHVRGYKSVGPSNIGAENGRFAAMGGNGLWATSVSLNFPFLFFPNNGIASMHLFANAGNLRMIESCEALKDVYSWVRNCACSFGGGLVITRIPLFGASPSGRFELNFSVPLGVDHSGNLTFKNGSRGLFERIKFGLVWSSNHSF